jgi:hypothetical protein
MYFKVRDVLEIPKKTGKFKVDREKLEDFDVFVQSTSYNRILVADSDFLYDTGEAEVKDDASAPSTSADTGLENFYHRQPSKYMYSFKNVLIKHLRSFVRLCCQAIYCLAHCVIFRSIQ